jgi:proteic killer suppression protein
MIQSFADKQTGNLFHGRKRKPNEPLPERYTDRAKAKLIAIDAASDVDELALPPSNRLHNLGGRRLGQYSLSINMQHRVCFRFEGGDARDVEVVDYHD